MSFVQSGSASVPLPDNPEIIQNVTFPAFYVSKEVTNKEYRQFVNDIVKNPAKKLSGTQAVLTSGKAKDSVVIATYVNIAKGIINTENLPFEDYWTNEKYDNYPVIGVSTKHAQYYAVWKYKKDYNEKVLPAKVLTLLTYNIPTFSQKFYIESKALPAASKERLLLNSANKGDTKGLYFVMIAPSYKK
ncbi:MAG: SUMF1/EgtB/PvdO family nonheme iron enzyme [Pyrinomonadaceae bacterium]|nr:SUMF1/EgtB/PvdO family nonheme iron enzyme [Sphingobacteriaceae bacterium]